MKYFSIHHCTSSTEDQNNFNIQKRTQNEDKRKRTEADEKKEREKEEKLESSSNSVFSHPTGTIILLGAQRTIDHRWSPPEIEKNGGTSRCATNLVGGANPAFQTSSTRTNRRKVLIGVRRIGPTQVRCRKSPPTPSPPQPPPHRRLHFVFIV